MLPLPNPPRLLVFDLDGTLIDSEQDLANSVNITLAHLGRPPLPLAAIRSFIGSGAPRLLDLALAATGLQPTPQEHAAALDFFLTHYRAHKFDHTRPLPGVPEALALLRDRLPNTPFAILTNKPVRPAREIVAGLNLAPFFFAVHGAESFPTKKPNPHGLLALIAEASTLTRSPITPADTVMIGDSVDLRTAIAAQTASLACTFGLVPAHLLAELNPSATAHHASNWPTLLTP